MSFERMTKREEPLDAFLLTLRAICILATLALLTPLPAHAVSWYSGTSVGSDGTVYGWGVTDGTPPPGPYMYHVAYVTTTLTSPVKHRQASNSLNHQNLVRVDVSLPFDPLDLGPFTTYSVSDAFCYAALIWFIYQQPSQASTTVPLVVITLRNGSNQTVSTDNAARNQYYNYNGTYALGTFQNLTNSFWQTNNELVGTVYPSTYTGYITLHRQILNLREDDNSTTAAKSYPPCPNSPTCDDTSDPSFRDDDPQSGGSAGKVYDVDNPGIARLATENTYERMRVNFREYAAAQGVSVQVSSDFKWWSRLSVYRPSGQVTTVLKTDVPNDNVSGTGTTPITWNLQ